MSQTHKSLPYHHLTYTGILFRVVRRLCVTALLTGDRLHPVVCLCHEDNDMPGTKVGRSGYVCHGYYRDTCHDNNLDCYVALRFSSQQSCTTLVCSMSGPEPGGPLSTIAGMGRRRRLPASVTLATDAEQ